MLRRFFNNKMIVFISATLGLAALLNTALPASPEISSVVSLLFAIGLLPLIIGVLIFMVFGLDR